MTIREATEADLTVLRDLVEAYRDEFWALPVPPSPLSDLWLQEGRIVVADLDGQVVGMAKGELRSGLGEITLAYLRPDARGKGTGKAMLRELAAFFREQGVEHVTLAVDLPNEGALAVSRRLGFAEYRRELVTELGALEQQLAEERADASFGSVHAQTDDQAAIERAVARFVPRLFVSSATVVSAPRNGWVAVYNPVASHKPDLLRRLAAELSNITGGVVLSLGAEAGAVVRLVAFDRGTMMDEYLSVPEYYGPLPPGDATALRANPTLLARLTGADARSVRAVARTAASPGELQPPAELLDRLAEALGIEGAELDSEKAGGLEGAVTVEHS
ncbi:MAG TPA: GNAT family N-acetyltransferase [Gaiellaceae bacterium]|nr:GNAT family N-acetyltransferase [Gaiellaceae bacterium]